MWRKLIQTGWSVLRGNRTAALVRGMARCEVGPIAIGYPRIVEDLRARAQHSCFAAFERFSPAVVSRRVSGVGDVTRPCKQAHGS